LEQSDLGSFGYGGHTVPTSLHAPVVLAFVTLIGDVAVAQSNEKPTESRNKAIVKASFDAWRAGTGGPFDLLADDAAWTIVGHSVVAKTYGSREAFMREVIRPFNARMRDPLKPTVRSIYADGNAVIIFFDASGTARDGKPYANTYAWFFDMREGKVVKAFAFFDSLEFNEFWQRVTPEPSK
jgi:uncharacterized protein